MINIYTSINEQIMQSGGQTTLFINVTQTLREIRETLEKIEVKLPFQHMWFPGGKFHSFWSYYNKVNVETDKLTEGPTIRRFLQRQQTPHIVKSESN